MKISLPRKKTKEQWLNDGEKHFLARQYEQAFAEFDRAIQLDPQDSDALYRREQALQRLQGT